MVLGDVQTRLEGSAGGTASLDSERNFKHLEARKKSRNLTRS